MDIKEALACLGASRVVWIDDHFNDTPELFAQLLHVNMAVTRACGFAELGEAVEMDDVDQDRSREMVAQAILDLPPTRQSEMRSAFFAKERELSDAPSRELSADDVGRTCALLGIAQGDQWAFDGLEAKLGTLCREGDEAIAYIVDLKDKLNPNGDEHGLDVLRALRDHGSRGTAFVLTHEAGEQDEGRLEARLRSQLLQDGRGDVPVCVISKQRMAGDHIEEALKISVKRAGLRRSVHEVLAVARGHATASFEKAASALLSIPPELLDSHVVERAYLEGVSELHVVERALTAQMARRMRETFASHPEAARARGRLRRLRDIPLGTSATARDDNLEEFRTAEVWEGDQLVNGGHAPLSCGDVFEIDTSEQSTRTCAKKRFVLLAQPCEILLRPNGKRQSATGVLVLLKAAGGETKANPKIYKLRFALEGAAVACDMRETTPARLSILDLATFRADGLVRYERDQPASEWLLPGQTVALERQSALFAKAFAARDAGGAADPDLALALEAPEVFKHVRGGTFEAAGTAGDPAGRSRCDRFTWRLRRCGRMRPEYASAVLDRYLGLVNRRAFDLDFTDADGTDEA